MDTTTYISIHNATQIEYDRIPVKEDSNGKGVEWKILEVGSARITIFAPSSGVTK